MQKRKNNKTRRKKKKRKDRAQRVAGNHALVAKKKQDGRKMDGSLGSKTQKAENGLKKKSGRNMKGIGRTG